MRCLAFAICVAGALSSACQTPTTTPADPPKPRRLRPHPSQAVRDGADHAERATPDRHGRFEGVEPGDTVARYRAPFERRDRMARSNQVAVDVPRFVQVTGTVQVQEFACGTGINRSVLAVQGQPLAGQTGSVAVRQRRGASQTANELSPALADGRMLPSGATADASVAVNAVDRSTAASTADVFSRRVRGTVISQAVVHEALPKHLVHAGYPLAIDEGHSLIEARGLGTPLQLSAGVPPAPRKPRLVLVKSVDRAQAAPGDVLTFTVQFHNIGDEALGNVLIVDSLAERLQYIPDSACASRKAKIETRLNALGKAEIYWRIQGTIAPDEFGTVQFKAKVTSF